MHTNQTRLQLVKPFTLIFLLFLLYILFSCKKQELQEPSEIVSSATSAVPTNGCETTICEDCTFQEMIEMIRQPYATVLGGTYSNPYSISNMTLAYNIVHGTNVQSVSTTHYYVRFKPQTEADLETLESLDLELFDYPLDRIVSQEGDYWPEAYTNLGPNEYPWFYTVVESNFQFPNGILYENLAPLNIPNDDAALENAAFNLTGNNECGGMIATSSSPTNTNQNGSGNSRYGDCDPGYIWDPVLRRCVLDVPPPQGAPTYLYPQGMISFYTYDDYGVIPYNAPLRYTRIVGRRFFKIDKTYTDASGNFQFAKRFPNKVTIIVKFKTSYLRVFQDIGWIFLDRMKKNIGTFRGNDLRNLNYVFQKSIESNTNDESQTIKTKHWLSAVAINTVIETKNFLSSNNLMPLPDQLVILLGPEDQKTPLYEFIRKSRPKNSGAYLQWRTDQVSSMSTSKVTINVAQQLGLVHLKQVTDPGPHPLNSFDQYFNSLVLSWSYYFGYFGGSNRPTQIAVWQAFAQHFGHTIANQVFGWGQYFFLQQGINWYSNGGISTSSNYLEGFNPNIGSPVDVLNWIPVGLINDLMDTNNETFPVIDNVSGFTYADILPSHSRCSN